MEISKESKKVIWEMMWGDAKAADALILNLSTEDLLQLKLALKEWGTVVSIAIGLRLHVEPVAEEEIRGKYGN